MSWLHVCSNHGNLLCEVDDDMVCSCGQSKKYHMYAAPAPALTLRDWFAGQALSGVLSDQNAQGSFDDICAIAYDYADTMLKEREKNEDGARP